MADPIFVIKLEEDPASAAASRGGGAAAAAGGQAPSGFPDLSDIAYRQKASEAAAASIQASSATASAARNIGNLAGNLGQQLGQAFGSFFGHQRAGGVLGQMVHQRIGRVPATPVVQPATMGDVMGLPHGSAYRVGADGVPIVDQASMTETMSAAAKGNIPVGRLVSGPPAGAGNVGSAAGGEGGGLSGMAGGPTALAAAAVMMHVNQWKQGISKLASTPKNDGGGLLSAASGLTFGPIGGMIVGAIVEKIVGAVGDAIRAPGQIAQRAGDIVGSAARGQNFEAVQKTYGAFVDLAREIPIVGHGLGLIGDSAGQVVDSFRNVTMAFVERGRELSSYSGPLAQSYAVSDVRQMYADIHEAQTLDVNLARLNDAQTEMSLTLREFLLPIKDFLIGALADLLEWLKPKLESGFDVINELGGKAVEELNAVGRIVVSIHNLLLKIVPGMNLIFDKKHWTDIIWEGINRHDPAKDMKDLWDKMDADFGMRHADKGPVQRNPGLNIPLLKQ